MPADPVAANARKTVEGIPPEALTRDAASVRDVILDAILMPDATREGADVRNAGRRALDELLGERDALVAALDQAVATLDIATDALAEDRLPQRAILTDKLATATRELRAAVGEAITGGDDGTP